MGHVINPISFRIKITRLWSSNYSITKKHDLNYFLMETINLKKLILNFFNLKIFLKNGFLWSHANFIRFVNKLEISVFLYKTQLSRSTKTFYFKKLTFKLFMHFYKKIIPLMLLNFIKNLVVYYKILLYKIENILFLTKKQNIIILLLFLRKKAKFQTLFVFLHFFFFKNKFNLFKKKSAFSNLKLFTQKKRRFKILKKFKKNKLSSYNLEFSNNFLCNFFLWYLRGRFWQRIVLFFKKICSFFFKTPISLKICKINFLGVNINIVGSYIINRLKQRFKILQLISPVLKDLKANKTIKGFKFSFCGRFSRKEMATCEWFSHGKVPSNTFNSFIEYKLFTVILKDSLCGIKIWITRRKNKAEKYNYFTHISNIIWYYEIH